MGKKLPRNRGRLVLRNLVIKMKTTLNSYLIPSAIAIVIAFCSSPITAEPDSEVAESKFAKYIAQGQDEGAYWPTKEWRTAKPEEVGMNSSELVKAIEYLAIPDYKTDGLVIVKNGYILAEAYLGSFQKNKTHTSASVAKSFTSAILGITIDKGLVPDIDAKLCQYLDQWDCDNEEDTRSRITIRHALTLTTGLKWHEDWSKFDANTNDALKMILSRKYLEYVLDREGVSEPGESFNYSTGDPMLISGVISKATGMSVLEFARKHLFQPIGISSARWESDSQGYTPTFAMLELTVRDYARFGYLYLNNGRWADKQIVSEEWVRKSTQTDPTVKMWRAYGYLWHVNLPVRLEAEDSNIPPDAYMAEGVLGQKIFIIPSNNLVIVKVASEEGNSPDLVKFLTMVLDSIDSGSK